MKQIELTQGQVALVDDEDYEWLNQWKWTAQRIRKTNTFRVVRECNGKTLLIHRIIMNTPEHLFTDHINNNPLDNRRENLRIATRTQNTYNTVSRTNKLALKGVCESGNKFIAKIQFNKKNIYLGTYDRKEDAAIAYDEAAKKYFGEFANLNFPEAL